MKRSLSLLCVTTVAILASCTSVSITPIGNTTLHPVAADAPVAIYTSEKEIAAPFRVVAVISYSNPGKYQVLSLGDAIPPLKDQARKAGANGIIIQDYRTIKSGIISTGIGVEAKAIIVEKSN